MINIRPAGEDDLPVILALYRVIEEDPDSVLTLAEAKRVFRRLGTYPDYHIYVACDGDRPVGTYALLIMDNLAHHGARSAIVEDVAVAADCQGRGIGRRMMQDAHERCRRAGCYKSVLSSGEKRGSAHRFYESLGFTRHGFSFRIDPREPWPVHPGKTLANRR